MLRSLSMLACMVLPSTEWRQSAGRDAIDIFQPCDLDLWPLTFCIQNQSHSRVPQDHVVHPGFNCLFLAYRVQKHTHSYIYITTDKKPASAALSACYTWWPWLMSNRRLAKKSMLRRLNEVLSVQPRSCVVVFAVSFSSFWKRVVLPEAPKKWVTLPLMPINNG